VTFGKPINTNAFDNVNDLIKEVRSSIIDLYKKS